MNPTLTKHELQTEVRKRTAAFQRIAKELGPYHVITKMMGSLAWGRHGHEHGPSAGIRQLCYEIGALDGHYAQLIMACNMSSAHASTSVMVRIWRGK